MHTHEQCMVQYTYSVWIYQQCHNTHHADIVNDWIISEWVVRWVAAEAWWLLDPASTVKKNILTFSCLWATMSNQITRAHRAHTRARAHFSWTWYRGTEVALWKMTAIAVLNIKQHKTDWSTDCITNECWKLTLLWGTVKHSHTTQPGQSPYYKKLQLLDKHWESFHTASAATTDLQTYTRSTVVYTSATLWW